MMNLKTCNRLELVTAYKLLEKRLSEYEQPQSKDDKELEFQKLWKLYGKKGNLKTSRSRFNKLSDKKKVLIFQVLPSYIKETPEKIYRKNAEAWLNQEGWNDVIKLDSVRERPTQGARAIYNKPTRPQSTVNVTDRISQMK